jgi:hypothetical protein
MITVEAAILVECGTNRAHPLSTEILCNMAHSVIPNLLKMFWDLE